MSKSGTYCYVMKNSNQDIVAKTEAFTLKDKDTTKIIHARTEMTKKAQEKYPGTNLSLQLVHAVFASKIVE